ncbi:unnamed protein product [Rotaria sordida]|uniref:Uncharacterized protein n=1 Tax=Rotaria sordida TaxID=392033 RepID=A0A815YNU4_9BILA|nr:unnamed protein product [Rotaria sordida]CAF1054140.1 unnamed protein product [Rotaria sordida]CAF1573531.1 unnamed protein product [Rotaria sordida]CAF3600236.1 unnamed protein product [Rotaria sordida]
MANSSSTQPETYGDQQNQTDKISKNADEIQSSNLSPCLTPPPSIPKFGASSRSHGSPASNKDSRSLASSARPFEVFAVTATNFDAKGGTMAKPGDSSSSWTTDKP